MNWHKIEATWRPAPFWSWNDAMDSKELEILEDNALSIHKVELNLAGQRVLSQAPIAKAWHQHFYPTPDGTPGGCVYLFNSPVGEKIPFMIAQGINLCYNLLCNGGDRK